VDPSDPQYLSALSSQTQRV